MIFLIKNQKVFMVFIKQLAPLDWPGLNSEPGTGHFMGFLVASHLTNPKDRLPDEDGEIR